MRRASFGPALTLQGREFKGMQGWSGKPMHPPLTDIPIGGYVLAAVLDLISIIGQNYTWSRDFYRAASFVLIGAAAVSVFTALTGFWDWFTSTEAGTQVRRTANAHALTMVTVTVLVLADIAVRVFAFWDDPHTPALALVLTLLAAALTILGSTVGGTLVYDYGFNVETAGDSPVWHEDQTDRGPDELRLPVAETQVTTVGRWSEPAPSWSARKRS